MVSNYYTDGKCTSPSLILPPLSVQHGIKRSRISADDAAKKREVEAGKINQYQTLVADCLERVRTGDMAAQGRAVDHLQPTETTQRLLCGSVWTDQQATGSQPRVLYDMELSASDPP